jgi:hypothetical protein
MSGPQRTPGLWEVDTVRNEGEYGNGPDTHSGFESFAVIDSEGRVLFDTLNRDGTLTEIHEESDDADGYHRAWDAKAQADLEHAVRCVNAHDDLLAQLQHAVRWFDQLTAADVERYRAAIARATGGAP